MTKRAGPRYAILPADAVTDPDLTGPDLKVLALLGRHIDRNGWCTRAQKRMAKELTVARGTLQRSLGRLVEAGYVEVERVRRDDGGQGANLYRVVLDDETREKQLSFFASLDGSEGAPKRPKKKAPPPQERGTPLPLLDRAPPASPERGTQEERPLYRTSPFQDAAQRGRDPASDPKSSEPVPTRTEQAGAALPSDASGAVPTVAAGSEADAVPFLAPAGDSTAAQRASKDLEARLRHAAGPLVSEVNPGLADTSAVYRWLAAGCDLEIDILPTIAGRAARHRAGFQARSWVYFEGAVLDAFRHRVAVRSAVAEPSTNVVPFDPRGPAVASAPVRAGRPRFLRDSLDEIIAEERGEAGNDPWDDITGVTIR